MSRHIAEKQQVLFQCESRVGVLGDSLSPIAPVV